MAPMVISNYLVVIFIMLACYPFVIIGVAIGVFDKRQRFKVMLWVNIAYVAVFIFSIVMHMQVEIVYGWELLEEWYRLNPEDRPK
ncbi:hypothetical protein [uncultured Photobacterium sp.]|uniref:hypothetical protein n=1 Tax=uncultured Photobacterium sp. TaxID=173973 RepID=UPI00260A22CC|nr:hypothetical protein [uncultured Photobacterium sp.]